MTVVGELLRFGTVHGWVPPETELLTQPKLLRLTPSGYDTGLSACRPLHGPAPPAACPEDQKRGVWRGLQAGVELNLGGSVMTPIVAVGARNVEFPGWSRWLIRYQSVTTVN